VSSWPDRRYWSLCLLVLPVVTLFGNALVCLAVFTERGLHTATNFFARRAARGKVTAGWPHRTAPPHQLLHRLARHRRHHGRAARHAARRLRRGKQSLHRC